jgi:hypothetical protein
MARVPWLDSVTIPNANQSYVLLDLIRATDSNFPNRRCAGLGIQADLNAGTAVFRVGNPGLTDLRFGVSLVATQLYSIAFESNLILLDDIYVRCSSAAQLLHLSIVVR